MLRKDYWEFCVDWILGFVMQKVLAPLLFIGVTYYYLNLNLPMTRGISYYGSICMWLALIFLLLSIGNILLIHGRKIYENDYGVAYVSLDTTEVEAEADKLKLTGEDRKLFKKRRVKADNLFKYHVTKSYHTIESCLVYSSLGLLGCVVLFMFLYLLTTMPVMITLSCELVKLGIVTFFGGFCWSM